MNTNQEKTKNSIIKALAIIGLIAIVIAAIWAGIQAIRVLPSAFSSLASVADTVYNNRPVDTLTVTTEKNIVNAGESLKVSWTELKREGDFSFYYTCTEGVSVEIRMNDGTVTPVRCGSPTALQKGDTSLDMIVHSEQKRFTDVPFTIAFTPSNEAETLFERNSKVTVVNATIPQSEELALEEEESENEVSNEEEASEEQEDDSETVGRVRGETQTIERTISYIPESHEDGFVDLAMTYLGVGELNGNNFTPTATIDNDSRGAIRFEVKNIGTKTSEDWTFEATLPTGFVFESNEQKGLKPNEKAVYTLGFDVAGESGIKEIEAELSVANDTNRNNNSFEWSVEITN